MWRPIVPLWAPIISVCVNVPASVAAALIPEPPRRRVPALLTDVLRYAPGFFHLAIRGFVRVDIIQYSG